MTLDSDSDSFVTNGGLVLSCLLNKTSPQSCYTAHIPLETGFVLGTKHK